LLASTLRTDSVTSTFIQLVSTNIAYGSKRCNKIGVNTHVKKTLLLRLLRKLVPVLNSYLMPNKPLTLFSICANIRVGAGMSNFTVASSI
jgi:hypothetical protein